VLGVQGPDPAALAGRRAGRAGRRRAQPVRQRERVDGYAAAGLEALAMEFMPRITRAQSMDILSSSRTSPATRRCSTRPPNMAAPFR
jgi:NAD(P) transhydrogenase subunit alpha